MTRAFLSILLSLGLALAFAGYPFVAALGEAFDISSTGLSITVRAIIVLISSVLFFKNIAKSRSKNSTRMLQVALAFWALYLIRMYYDTLINSTPMFLDPLEYWVWGIGASFVPFLAFATVAGEDRNGHAHFTYVYVVFVVAAILIALTASTVVRTDYGDAATGRLNLTALNPISLGHVGTSLFLLSFWALFCWKIRHSKMASGLHIGSMLLGLFLMIASNSRGPLVALIIALVCALWAQSQSRKLGTLALIIFATFAFIPSAQFIDANFDTVIYQRLFGQSQFEEGNVLDRYDRYITAMKSFAEQPFLGTGMELRNIGGYPHNVIVESFIAVGLLGAAIFIGLLIALFIKSIKLLKKDTGYGWLSLLFVQYAVGAQFSGAIYSSTIFWAATGLIISLALPPTSRYRRRRNLDRPIASRLDFAPR